jgi:hypothetical protein
MDGQVPVETLRGELLAVLEEIFAKVHGYLLDPGDAFFETLAGISAQEASRPVSTSCASLAAQVNHVRFYIDVILEIVASGPRKTDWAASWRVGPVSDAEWQDLIDRLRASYAQAQTFVRTCETWDEDALGGAIALVGHCAYHLGQIRQSLCLLRDA